MTLNHDPHQGLSRITFRLSGCKQPSHHHQDLPSVRSNRVVSPSAGASVQMQTQDSKIGTTQINQKTYASHRSCTTPQRTILF
jgi:hypothetical protein